MKACQEEGRIREGTKLTDGEGTFYIVVRLLAALKSKGNEVWLGWVGSE